MYNSKSMKSLRSVLALSNSEAAELILKVIEFHKIDYTNATVDNYGSIKSNHLSMK